MVLVRAGSIDVPTELVRCHHVGAGGQLRPDERAHLRLVGHLPDERDAVREDAAPSGEAVAGARA